MWLLDTNVILEMRKRSGKADENVARWISGKDTAAMFISMITLQELETGVLRVEKKDAARGSILCEWFDWSVRPGLCG